MEIDSRFIAFENDHTYLKKTYADTENAAFLQATFSTVK